MKKFKKIIVAIIVVAILIISYTFLTKNECASCAFVHNDPDYNGYCPEMCFRAPKWKIFLFEITGNNFGYKK